MNGKPDTPRGPSATELHERAIAEAIRRVSPVVTLAMVCRACRREPGQLHAAGCYVARRHGWPEDAA